MSSSGGRRKNIPSPDQLHKLTPEQEAQIWEVVQYGIKIAKKYFSYGEEIGCAVRDRMIESVVRNATVRGHITHRKEIHTIIRRCYVDEIRSRYQKKHPSQDGQTLELRDDVRLNTRRRNDGGISEMEQKIYLEQEAVSLLQQSGDNRRRRGRAGTAFAKVAMALSEEIGGNDTMQDIADRAGVSKASVSRAFVVLADRHEKS